MKDSILLVFANKQDQPGSLNSTEVSARPAGFCLEIFSVLFGVSSLVVRGVPNQQAFRYYKSFRRAPMRNVETMGHDLSRGTTLQRFEA